MATMLCSCVAEEPQSPTDTEREGTYLSLRIGGRGFGGSRAGVAEGYDREDALRNENTIYNLTLFFLRGATDINDDDANIYGAHYIGRSPDLHEGGEARYTVDIPDLKPMPGDRVIVVVNMGDLSGIGSAPALREATSRGWRESGSLAEYDMFAMSSCRTDDGYIVNPLAGSTSAAGSRENPLSVSVSVERLAARIDLWFDRKNIEGDKLAYNTSGGTGRVYVTDVAPTNVMKQPTYVLKHVSAGTGSLGPVTVCGEEYLGDDGLPSNYVVEPTSTRKGDATLLEGWYGDSRAGLFESPAPMVRWYPLGGFLGDSRLLQNTKGEHEVAMTIAYANENTYEASAATADHVTGLAVKAVFTPDGMAYGQDFWRVAAADLDESKSRYFGSEAEARDFAASNAGYLSPVHYPGGVCYYSIWLRHRLENTSEELVYPMEFGTVRNHIYRVGFGFRGPGTTHIDIKKPEQHVAELYVREWNFRRLGSIIM